jgi:signal transduction histidine kinase
MRYGELWLLHACGHVLARSSMGRRSPSADKPSDQPDQGSAASAIHSRPNSEGKTLMEQTRVVIIDDVEEIHNNIRTIFRTRKNELLDTLNKEIFGANQTSSDIKQELHLSFDSAFQGQEGYELVKKAVATGKPYSVAIVDMRMPPGWDGLQTIRKIREVDQDIEIVICSAYSDYSWHDIAQELSVTDKYLFLSKPFEVTEMKQMVINLAEKWWLNTKNKIYLEELRKARENAEASERAKHEFLGIIGHELRTPLNVILMTLEDLLDNQNDKEALKIIRNSHKSTLHLAQLIEDILTYTEMDKNDFRFAVRPFKMEELINMCRQQFESMAQDRNLQFTIEADTDIPATFVGDLQRTYNALFQLLSNSIKFTDKGFVKLSIRIDENFPRHTVVDVLALRFIVEDSGWGMNPEQLAQCFDLFYQGESAKNHSRTGSGLGLSLCRKIVLAMGGTLGMDSEPGRGTQAWLILPLKLAGNRLFRETA